MNIYGMMLSAMFIPLFLDTLQSGKHDILKRKNNTLKGFHIRQPKRIRHKRHLKRTNQYLDWRE
ncbi:MAG: hypothetical protein WCR28_01940 [Candidatus Izemoplasmatales bacterium]|nr:hypothetical protein [Candidatus Izemoplasmatales bacterium]